jgi:ATP-dependent Lon protease
MSREINNKQQSNKKKGDETKKNDGKIKNSNKDDKNNDKNKNNKNIGRPALKKRHIEVSSSDSSSSSSNESDDNGDEEEPNNTSKQSLDMHEYRKEIAKLFPSKHLNDKIKAGERLKSVKKMITPPVTNVKTISVKKKNKPVESEEEEEEEEDDDEESDDESCDEDEESDEDESEEDEEEIVSKSKNKKGDSKGATKNFNIVFTIGEKSDADDEWETDSYSEDEYDEDEDDDEEEEEEDEDIEVSDSDDDASESKPSSKKTNEDALKTAENILSTLSALQTNKDDKIFKDCVKACETTILATKTKLTKKSAKQKEKNERIFKKNLRQKSAMNDLLFFKKLDIEQQKKIIKELREINKLTMVEKPHRLSLLESSMPIVFKSAAMKRINTLKHMEQGSGEYYKIKNWVDTFMKIPFGVYETLPVSLSNGVDDCHTFMESALSKLNSAVYGLNDAKMQIMQMLGQLISNPSSVGTSIAIHGPMGTGKTSLVREGISKILNRPFAFIALGGATDSSFLEGHSYTYEGSTWGQIVQILIASKCMNPVIYFDELDKISETPKGEEIASILTHLTDSSQNSQFHDKYFSDVDFDLSKCLFIFSYNDESKINPILRDRMYKIKTSGYDKKQKVIISNQYLLPRIRELVNFDEKMVTIPDESLQYIIDTHCAKEEGVRNLKRCLEIIHTKLNLYRLMKPGTNLFEQEISLKVEFPFVVTKEMVDKIIKTRTDNDAWKNLYN